ncbi:MAG: hemolysin secretion protein D [SAR86 cluster bacterium]|uniref:Membrane fusion protein (MFP) family protein n=1 Tax=SAR86 cluster bacterium TaxID=2030880 RepID=A0A2A4X3C6_9GAMM|nr:MAG: hemolysin secretion protein D [SAR86 cluster bacterium]
MDLTLLNNSPAIDPSIEALTSMETPKRFGLGLFFLVFGVFGLWATLAPIEGAAHAPGTVAVKSYKKIVQHLEGGIVSEIRVRDGDFVNAGDPLLILDNTQSLSQLEIVNAQFVADKALEARLIAERDELNSVSYPPILSNSEFNASTEIDAQSQIFDARRITLQGSVEVLQQRIGQLQSSLVGLHALKESKEELARSYDDELQDVRALLEDGFSNRTRLRELERNSASFKGEAAELTASISSTQIKVGETRLQILQQENEFRNDVIGQLAETQTRLKDSTERINALQDVVSRTIVRAPVAGRVNGMQTHTEGGVVIAASEIAQIVPQSEELIIEARLSPLDIDRVSEGQEAIIRFSTFSRNVVPTIFGNVISISADSFIDELTGASYYMARIEVNPDGLEDLSDLALIPGMPAEAFISSGSRTLLQYLFKPLSNSIARSLIED